MALRRIPAFALAFVLVAAGIFAAHAGAAPHSAVLDGVVVNFPNQGDSPKVTVVENTNVDCEPGTIRVGPKIDVPSGRVLNLTAPAGEVILGVSIKSGASYTVTATWGASTATITVSQDISNYVVVYCQPEQDESGPVCVLTATGFDGSGAKYIQVTVQDSQSGIQTIVVDEATNASISINPDPYAGTLNPVVITATKIDQTLGSFVKITITNGAGVSTTCDPPVPAVKKTTKQLVSRAAALRLPT